jgi:hypothetical protein
MRDGIGKIGSGPAPYRVWVILLTVAYTNDLLAHLARVGFAVLADDPPCIKGRSVAVFSCRLGVTDRLIISEKERREKKMEEDRTKVSCPLQVCDHQPLCISAIVDRVLTEQKMLHHAVIVATCEDAEWHSGNIDLGAIDTYRQNYKSRLS